METDVLECLNTPIVSYGFPITYLSGEEGAMTFRVLGFDLQLWRVGIVTGIPVSTLSPEADQPQSGNCQAGPKLAIYPMFIRQVGTGAQLIGCVG